MFVQRLKAAVGNGKQQWQISLGQDFFQRLLYSKTLIKYLNSQSWLPQEKKPFGQMVWWSEVSALIKVTMVAGGKQVQRFECEPLKTDPNSRSLCLMLDVDSDDESVKEYKYFNLITPPLRPSTSSTSLWGGQTCDHVVWLPVLHPASCKDLTHFHI